MSWTGYNWRPLGPAKGNPRQKILAQWRGIDLQPLENIKKAPGKKMDQILPRVLADLRIDRRQSEAEIVRVWQNLMDPTIVAHANPVGIAKGTLFVNVDSSVWLDEIVRYRRKEILDRMQHSFGKDVIKKISFRIG